MESVSPRNNDLVDSMSSRSPSVSSNGTPENKDTTSNGLIGRSDFLSHSPTSVDAANTYSRRLVDRKRALFKQHGDTSDPAVVNGKTNGSLLVVDRVQPSGKVGSRQRPEQRPEQRAARRNKERERKHLVKEALHRLTILLPESSTGRKTKVTLDVVKDACDLIVQLQEQSRRSADLEALQHGSLPISIVETHRRYERLLTLAGIPIDTDPDVLEAQLHSVTGAPTPQPQVPSPQKPIVVVAKKPVPVKSKPSTSSQAPYLVVSPNGSCTLSTDQPRNDSEDKQEHDSSTNQPQNEDLLLMVACSEDDNKKQDLQKMPATPEMPLVALGPNPGQIVLAGGSLPPSSLPQVLLLPDGRLVPVSMAGVDQQDPSQQQMKPAAISPKKDTTAARSSVIQPGQRAILPKIAARPPAILPASSGANRPIAPRRPPVTAQHQQQQIHHQMQQQQNFPVIFIAPQTQQAPQQQMVAVPITSLPPGLTVTTTHQQQQPQIDDQQQFNITVLPPIASMISPSKQQPQQVTPNSSNRQTPPNQIPEILVEVAPPAKESTTEELLADVVQPDASFMEAVVTTSTPVENSASTQEIPAKKKQHKKHNASSTGGKKMPASTKQPEGPKTSEIEIFLPSSLAKATMAVPSKSPIPPQNAGGVKKKTSPLAKKLTVVDCKPTNDALLPEAAISLLIGEQKPLAEPVAKKSNFIELPLDLSAPLPPLKPSKLTSKSKSKGKQVAVEFPIEPTGYGPLLRIQTKGAQKAAGLMVPTPTATPSPNLPVAKSSSVATSMAKSSAVLVSSSSSSSKKPTSVVQPAIAVQPPEKKKRRKSNNLESVVVASAEQPTVAAAPFFVAEKGKKEQKKAKKTENVAASASSQKPASSSSSRNKRKIAGENGRIEVALSISPELEAKSSKRIESLTDEELSSSSTGPLSRPLSALVAERKAQQEAEGDPFDRLLALSSSKDPKSNEVQLQPAEPSGKLTSNVNEKTSRADSAMSNHHKEPAPIEDRDYDQPPKAPAPLQPDEDHAPPPFDDDYEPPHAPRPADDDILASQRRLLEEPAVRDDLNPPEDLVEQKEDKPEEEHHEKVQQQAVDEVVNNVVAVSSGASVPLHHIDDPTNRPASTMVISEQQVVVDVDQQQHQQPVKRRSSIHQQQQAVSNQQSGHLTPFLLSSSSNAVVAKDAVITSSSATSWYEPPVERPQSSAAQPQQSAPKFVQTNEQSNAATTPASCSMASSRVEQPQPAHQQNRQSGSHQQQQQLHQAFGMDSVGLAGMQQPSSSSGKRSKLDIQAVQAVVDSQLQAQAQAALLAPFLDPHPTFASTFSNMLLGQTAAAAVNQSRQSATSTLANQLVHQQAQQQHQQLMDNAMFNLLQSAANSSNPTPFGHQTMQAPVAGVNSTQLSRSAAANAAANQSMAAHSNRTAAQFLNNIFPQTANPSIGQQHFQPQFQNQFYNPAGGVGSHAPSELAIGQHLSNLAMFNPTPQMMGRSMVGMAPGAMMQPSDFAAMQQCRGGGGLGASAGSSQAGWHQPQPNGVPPTMLPPSQHMARGMHQSTAPFNPFNTHF